MNQAAAYASVMDRKLVETLALTRSAHQKEIEKIKAKHAEAMAMQRRAVQTTNAEWKATLQKKESDNAALRRDLHCTRDELERAHALLAEQTKRLVAFDRVAELEQKLQVARKSAS
jgi:hypothetical protein